MRHVENGDTVKVHYTGKLTDGTVFDSTEDREPFRFRTGEGQVIPGFEKAVIGMKSGESKTTEIPSDEAYGPHRKDLITEIDLNQLPENITPEVGQRLQSVQEDGSKVVFSVTDVSESSVTLDANHPLAGEKLIFDIELLEIA